MKELNVLFSISIICIIILSVNLCGPISQLSHSEKESLSKWAVLIALSNVKGAQ